MKDGMFIRRVRPVHAVRWDGHADGHPLVRQLATEHDSRHSGDHRELGICTTHYGRRHILAGDYIVTEYTGAVDVISGTRFLRDYEEFNA